MVQAVVECEEENLTRISIGVLFDAVVVGERLVLFSIIDNQMIEVFTNTRINRVEDINIGEETTITIDEANPRHQFLSRGYITEYNDTMIVTLTDFIHSVDYTVVGFYPGTHFPWYKRKASHDGDG